MSSSNSSTPPSLTPQSTGNHEASRSSSTTPYKKPQVAFYPHVNSSNKPQKPFSRSAAKRESVMALGSIEHLQHYFTKTGIAAKKESGSQQRKGLVPAIGGLQGHIRANPSITSVDLPPSPAIPATTRFENLPYVRIIETDPENLRPGVIEDLVAVERVWHLGSSAPSSSSPPEQGLLTAPGGHAQAHDNTVDVLGVLKTTTRAVRSVRNYLLSLPDDDAGAPAAGGGASFRTSLLPGARGSPHRRLVSRPDDPSDPLTLIRRSALEVLTMLRALEEACRVPLSDDAYDAQSDGGSASGSGSATGAPGGTDSRVASPEALSRESSSGARSDDDAHDTDAAFAFSVMQVPGRSGSILVWEEEEDEFRADEDAREPRERWDERLVLGSGWLYRPDVTFTVIAHEQDIVARYLAAVDGVLFGGARDGFARGWLRERERLARREQQERRSRRVSAPAESTRASTNAADFTASTRRGRRVVSTGMIGAMQSLIVTEEPDEMDTLHEDEEEDDEDGARESVDDDDLPEWARRAAFADDNGLLTRAHALLSALLPAGLAALLPPAGDRDALLSVLSSGQLLCVAYNTGVRRSKKPWGYISKDGIHDIVALEQARTVDAADDTESAKKSWTFRRTDNLRLWAAALKIRYMLPIVVPAAPLPQGMLAASESARSLRQTPSMSSLKFPKHERPIHFDARAVARKEDGWETMLENALSEWVRVVVAERRGELR